MNGRVEYLIVNGAKVRINDGLLLVVGNHGVGKTEFLHKIIGGEYFVEGNQNLKIVPMLLTQNHDECPLCEGNHQEYVDFVNAHFDKRLAEMLLQRVPTIEDLHAHEVNHTFIYRRILLTSLLLETKERMLVVFDEPELGAHLLMIRELCVLIRQLQEMGHIVVVATNSETVVSRLFEDIEQVVRLEKNQKFIQPNADVLEKEIREFYHQDEYLVRKFSDSKKQESGLCNVLENYIRIYLSSIFRNSIFMIMHSDGVILGEGSSEDVLFDYIDQVLHPKWMRENRIYYLGCLGKSTMPFYFLFLNHVGIRTVCLFDTDKETNPVHQAYAKAFQYREKNYEHMFSKLALSPDLEHVLQIDPDYKMASFEKPVHIFQHTFETDQVKDKVIELANLIKVMFDQM